MRRIIRDFLKDEEHASKVLIEGTGIIFIVGFIVAVAAILFMR